MRALAFSLSLLAAAPLRADDRPMHGGECHPPVVGVIDPDWRGEALRFREQSLRAFAREAGGDAAARRMLREALQLAEQTRVSAYDVLQITRELLLRGARRPELQTLRGWALDAQAALGAEAGARFLRALFALRQKPRVGEADLRELDELFGAPLVREAVGLQLAGAGETEARQALAERRLRAGSVEGGAAAEAAILALGRVTGRPQPGEAARHSLSACVTAMSRTCSPKEAEGHCKSTPRAYLELMGKGL